MSRPLGSYGFSTRDKAIIEFIRKEDGCFTDDLAREFKITTQCAKGILLRMFRRELIGREDVRTARNSTMYLYYIID